MFLNRTRFNDRGEYGAKLITGERKVNISNDYIDIGQLKQKNLK